MNPLRKIRDAYRRCLQRLVRFSHFFENLYAMCYGVAVLGATDGRYSIALGVIPLMIWARDREDRIRELERVVAENRKFWESAKSDDHSGDALIEAMREMCDTAVPAVPALANAQDEPARHNAKPEAGSRANCDT